jgi:rubrerythrin
LAPGVIVFPSTEMQEKVHALSHFDLVLSQIPGEMLQGLQASIVQELNLCATKTSDELAKATTEIASMWIDYNRVERERDAAAQKEEQVKQAFDKVCKEILEVPMEVDTPLEDQVVKINEAIQGF